MYISGLALGALFITCGNPPIPKPEGYYRISLPEESFRSVKITCGLGLDKPENVTVEIVDSEKSGDACWFNLNFKTIKTKCRRSKCDGNPHSSYAIYVTDRVT